MTLKELIEKRGHKYDDDVRNKVSASDFYSGYIRGWSQAYRDLQEILEQNGFNLNIEVKG